MYCEVFVILMRSGKGLGEKKDETDRREMIKRERKEIYCCKEVENFILMNSLTC